MIPEDILTPTLRPESPSRYLESFIYMDETVSPNAPGFLSLDGQPWAREILDSVVDPTVR